MLAKRIFLTLAIALLTTAPAHAVILTYSVETNYNAAASAELWRVDFNEGTPETLGDAKYDGKVDFGTPGSANPTQVKYIVDAADGISIMSSSTSASIGGVFDDGLHAFAWDFSSVSTEQWVHLFDEGGSLIESRAAQPSGFFGIISDQAIYSFQIQGGIPTSGDSRVVSGGVPERFFIDNFRANGAATAVPEPGTFLLLGTGLVGLGAAYRRRKK